MRFCFAPEKDYYTGGFPLMLSGLTATSSSEYFGVPRETWVIFSIRTINSLGFSATVPFLGVYLLTTRGVPFTEIGLVYLVTGILGIGSQVLGGRLTDSIGPKKVMLSGYTASVFSSVLLGYLVLSDASVYAFFVLYPLFSLMRGISQPATASIIAGQKAAQIRTGFSFLNIGGNLGFAIGPALAGPMIDATGFATAFVLSACAASAAGFITLFAIEGGRRYRSLQQEAGKAVKRWLSWENDRNVVLFLLVVFAMFLCIGYEITPLSLYVAGVYHFTNTEIGYLFATNGLLIVLLQLPLTKLMERSRQLLLPLIFSSGFATLAFVIAGFASTFAEWELFMGVITLGEISLSVPSQTVFAFFSRAGNRGTYQGYYSAFSNAGRSLSSFIGTSTFTLFAFYPALSWFGIAIFSLCVGIGIFFLSPRLQSDYEGQLANAKQFAGQ
ncbi:MAG: MFS transporter [Nitrososphaerales archaeon]